MWDSDLLEDQTNETEEAEIKNESSEFFNPIYKGAQLTFLILHKQYS